jgi:acetyl-CoA synthase
VSKIIASAGIRGAHKTVARARKAFDEAREAHGGNTEVGFPNTGYYLPCIYGLLGRKVEKLDDMAPVFDQCDILLPRLVKGDVHLPYLGPALDAGMAALFAQEMEECIRYLNEPDFYVQGEDVEEGGNIWLGAADDIILRKRGVEFVDGTAPGFAAILGAAPSPEVAAKIALELQEKNLYVFMAGEHEGKRFSEQLVEAGTAIGWPTRLVSFSPDVSGAVFALGFATRAAMSFGGVEAGDFRKILIYNKDRVFAFAMTFGTVTDEWYANGLACVNYGFPVIADTPIPEIHPTGVCTYEHVVSNIPHEEIVQKSVEVRGLKVSVSKVDVPVSYGAAFEGERVRGPDIYFEGGGGRGGTFAVEWTTKVEMDEIEDHDIKVIGPEIDELGENSKASMAIRVDVAGREFQEDFEPILERQIHHLVNFAQGAMHIGQRDIAWYRIAKGAVEKGFRFKHLGEIIWAKYHSEFGSILDKVAVTIYTEEDKAREILEQAREAYAVRDARVQGMKDEDEETYYSCTLCQSFAPSHVCVVTPERTGLCGAYSWLDCKASNEINPTGPNQPIEKGRVIDEVKGQWEGVNEFVRKASRGSVERYNAYSIMDEPMTSCGCFEAISALLPMCNGIMSVDRDYSGMTPSGMKFTTLAGSVGGGAVTPGFVGHSKLYIVSEKFIRAEGGIARLCWLPKQLKEELGDKINEVAAKLGYENFVDLIADETVSTEETEIMEWLTEKGHPAVTSMDPIM